MEQELYDKAVASFICVLTGWSDALEIRDCGVFVKDSYLDNDPAEQAFTWTPACEMDWHDAPNPMTAPALPIPFTASELATFILDAAGYGIQSRFGWIEHGLDEGELERLGIRATKVIKALKEAYSLAQRAQCVAGADNHDEQQRAADLLSAYSEARSEAMARGGVMDFDIPRDEYLRRLNRVEEAVDMQKADAKRAASEAETRHRKWRKAMVRELLRPEESCSRAQQSSDAQPQTQTSSPAPEVNASNGPAPLTTGDIAFCFAGLRWDEQGWKKPLGDKPKWLSECVAIPGQRGVSEARWNPVLIGAALAHQGHVEARKVRAKFQTVDLLKPWFDAWKTYEADNFDTP